MAMEDPLERPQSEQGISVEKGEKDPGQQKQSRKQSLVDAMQRSVTGGLRPDDIGIVRIEFSVPASRLFGNFSGGGGAVPIVTANNDTDDPVIQSDSDSTNKPLVANPGPGHFDTKDGS
jgi:hypothetical protein